MLSDTIETCSFVVGNLFRQVKLFLIRKGQSIDNLERLLLILEDLFCVVIRFRSVSVAMVVLSVFVVIFFVCIVSMHYFFFVVEKTFSCQ